MVHVFGNEPGDYKPTDSNIFLSSEVAEHLIEDLQVVNLAYSLLVFRLYLLFYTNMIFLFFILIF